MLYTYITCILFAILAILYNTAASQPNVNACTSPNHVDLDALLQQSIDRQVLEETKQERTLQYLTEQRGIHREMCKQLAREQSWELAYQRGRVADLEERQFNHLCHQLSCLRITKVRWAENTYIYFEPEEDYSESEVSTVADEY